MRKKLLVGMLGTAMAMTMNMTAFAGQWMSDDAGWWYQNDDGGYPANTWQWIDGNSDGIAESYYFNGNGYCAMNTTTPDGYTVNESGAWTVGGVVQTQTAGEQKHQAAGEVPDIAGTYVGTYNGRQIKAVFQKEGDNVWAEVDEFLKDYLPPYKGDGLFENEYNSFQFSGKSSLIFKDLLSGETVYFIKS